MWKNIVLPDGPQMTVWCMRIAYWILITTNKHSEYVILIAFPMQKLFNGRASTLRFHCMSFPIDRVTNGCVDQSILACGADETV
jgi:hypothetical protein